MNLQIGSDQQNFKKVFGGIWWHLVVTVGDSGIYMDTDILILKDLNEVLVLQLQLVRLRAPQ